MLLVTDVLSAEDLARVRQGLGDAMFTDGRRTARGRAREVKANTQARGEAVAPLAAFIRSALDRHALVQAYARPVRWSGVLFNRYRAGDRYGLHMDDPLMGEGEYRLRTDLSFTLFLSDPASYEGGELVLDGPDGEREVKPAAGSLLLYETGVLHRVAEVTSGERLAAVGWIQSEVRRADQREVLFDLARVRTGISDGEAALLLDKSIGNLVRQWAEV